MPYIKQFHDERASCLSYYLCCPEKAKCAVIDPSDDVERYLVQAENDFSDISAVIDTHIHGDHISGARRLAQRTGAPIYMYESSDVKFGFEAIAEGETIPVGTIILKAIFTPGHTHESMSLLYIDRKRVESPWGLFSGDTLFVGDIGRLDFSGAGTASQMYDSLFNKLLGLPDYVELYPAHYVGSVCGKKMSLKTTSTVGFERKFNPALQAKTFNEFEEYLFNNRMEPFSRHIQIKETNSSPQVMEQITASSAR